jgi:hypothetical protein
VARLPNGAARLTPSLILQVGPSARNPAFTQVAQLSTNVARGTFVDKFGGQNESLTTKT